MFKSLKGLIAGLFAGAAVGMLFSPKKGSEIRKDFKKEFKGGGTGLHTAKDTLTNMSKDIGETCKEGKDAIHAAKKVESKARKVFNELKHKLVGKKK